MRRASVSSDSSLQSYRSRLSCTTVPKSKSIRQGVPSIVLPCMQYPTWPDVPILVGSSESRYRATDTCPSSVAIRATLRRSSYSIRDFHFSFLLSFHFLARSLSASCRMYAAMTAARIMSKAYISFSPFGRLLISY